MRGFKIIFILAGLAIIGISTQCTYKKWPEAPSTSVPDTISFNKQLEPLFIAYCTTGPCHNANYASYSPNAVFSLDSSVAYTSLLYGGRGYVVPGNPGTSILYQDVNDRESSSYGMPQNPYPPLSVAQVQEIYNWIQQGAKNN